MPKHRIQNKNQKVEELRKEQDNCCFYCCVPFDTPYDRYSKSQGTWTTKWTKPQLDHVQPFVYTQSHPEGGFVLACEICNNIKNDMIINDPYEARLKIINRFKKKLLKGKLRFLDKDLPDDFSIT